MTMIGELISQRAARTDGPLMGIEIEVEGVNLPDHIDGWTTVAEGSLRPVDGHDGREYISSHPKTIERIRLDLMELHKSFNDNDTDPQWSSRTSVHTHVNVQDMTVEQWFTFLFLWVLYEDALIEFCGDTRKGNLFCLSTRDAEGLMFELERFARGEGLNILNDEVRYSAVNTAATYKYGSLEFRAMRGTHDPAILLPWFSTLMRLREKAIEIGSPSALIDRAIADESSLTKEVFGDKHFVYDFPELPRSVRSAAFRCSLIVDGCDWDKFRFFDEPYNDI